MTGPAACTNAVASSKCVYFTEKSSLEMHSLIEDLRGWDRSITSLHCPSFLRTTCLVNRHTREYNRYLNEINLHHQNILKFYVRKGDKSLIK